MFDFITKQSVLEKLYRIYDDFSNNLELACKKKCAACCTRNVIVTSMETVKIVKNLMSTSQADLLKNVLKESGKERFIPKITINELANICMKGEEPPQEENNPMWGKCMLLKDNECSVYDLRPFACRCMGSLISCTSMGYAKLDPFTITVNEIFMQYIEHIDTHGVTGNLIDMLLFLGIRENRQSYEKNGALRTHKGLLQNMAMPVLMIPPEHREKAKPILKEIAEIK